MDQGVIRSLKAKCHRKIIKRLIRAVDMKKKLPQKSMLDAMQLLQSAWSEVSQLTIKNCFQKIGISEKLVEQAINEEDDPFKDITADLEETITELHELLPGEASEELNPTYLLDVDAELSTNREKPSDAEIIAEIRSEVPDDEDETDIDFVIDDPKVLPTEIEIEKAIETLEELSMFCEDGEILRTAISNVNLLSQISMLNRKRQKTIQGYFRN